MKGGLRALLAGAALLASASAWPAAWPSVPLPEHSQGEWVTRHMNYNGLHMRASRFVTTLPLEDVKQFYKGLWGEQHVENEIAEKTILGHASGQHFITVELKNLGEGTEGIVGVLEMVEGEVDLTPGEGFPVPGGSEVMSDVRYLDGPRESRMLSVENGRTPFVNHQFYYHQLRMQGWRISSDPTECRSYSNTCIAGFERQDQVATLVFARGQAGSQVVAVIE